jgi:hypothetical protein
MKTKPQTAQEAFVQAVAALWPVAKGSVALVRRPCIRANCPACRSGMKHAAWIFTFRQEGRQRCRYVPQDLAPLLRQAILNGRLLEARLTQAGVDWIERLREERARQRQGGV